VTVAPKIDADSLNNGRPVQGDRHFCLSGSPTPRALARGLSRGAPLLVALAMTWCSVAVAAGPAEQPTEGEARETPLYQQDPYDVITLDSANNSEVLKVEPLPKPVRPVGGQLKVRLWDNPEKLYEVQWSAIAKIESFEQLVLAKAKQLIQQGKRDDAFDYFQWLQSKNPDQPEVKQAVGDYLFAEARIQRDQGRYVGALAMLVTLYDYDPAYRNLSAAFGAIEEELFKQYDAAGNYSALRALLANLRVRFPDHPTAVKWEADLRGRATDHLNRARAAVDRGNYREADHAAQQAVLLWPDLPGVQPIVDLLHVRYPRVVVGVTTPAVNLDPRHRDDWSTRRASRLVYRTLTEFLGAGSEGGNYVCPVGDIDVQPLQRRLTIQIRPGIRWAQGDDTLTGVDVARGLLSMADPGSSQYSPPWGSLFADATVRDVYHVEVDMRQPHVRPDALLGVTLIPHAATAAEFPSAPPNGPYIVDRRDDKESVYIASRQYFAATPTQPREIAEQYFNDDGKAIRALRDGQIKVLDRISPWTLEEFRSLRSVIVEPYAAPLVHCLIPNRRRPLMAEGTFRRAIVYGIHREVILNQLLGGKAVEGCSVTSGPFPKGVSYDDPLGYAYDIDIDPRPCEPGLAVMLATYAVDTIAAEAAKKTSAKPADQKPTEPSAPAPAPAKPPAVKTNDKTIAQVTLAYPSDPIARFASVRIKEHLAKAGIDVTLRELPPGPIERIPDDVDLLYAELPVWEPVVDANELLSADGLSGGASVYMNQTLRQLQQAADWQQLRPILRKIHRIAYDDVAVVPLWQLLDHFAYHASLKGVGDRPVTLYQNVEQWKWGSAPSPETSPETP
jgi:ABC-type transport system substrate-binding protein/tetratricopeptide (TPR) repeat protein